MKTFLVLGLGYGDEGKGLTTDYLCSRSSKPIVIRFNGGHQAGHTVVKRDGSRHVFSSFGSGTLREVPTFWSRYCTFYPPGFLTEWTALSASGHMPVFYIDRESPVTTCYDVVYNRALEQSRSPHGSCGLGFGSTIEREENGCRLRAADLYRPEALAGRLREVAAYYASKVARSGNKLLEEIYHDYDLARVIQDYTDAVSNCLDKVKIVEEAIFFAAAGREDYSFIFEGAQGILLDQDFGTFPHVTRSSTCAKNAAELIRRNHLPNPHVYYVTRCYQTRHGAGPLSNETVAPRLQHNSAETNRFNPWQGAFRTALLDLDQLHYAIRCDDRYTAAFQKHLVITCLDQLEGAIEGTLSGIRQTFTPGQLAEAILPSNSSCLLGYGPGADTMQELTLSLFSGTVGRPVNALIKQFEEEGVRTLNGISQPIHT